jgi:hypothetical protein
LTAINGNEAMRRCLICLAHQLYKPGIPYDKASITKLHHNSYHASDTFSVNYPFSGILDALGPDLLHQVSKRFMDYIMKQWLKPLIVRYWKEKGIKKEEDSSRNRQAIHVRYCVHRFEAIFKRCFHGRSPLDECANIKILCE